MSETFYITKYALSGGIFSIESEVDRDGWVKDTRPGGFSFDSFRSDEAFRSKEDAVADAEKRRVTKILSLEKQIAKLRKLTFSVDEPK